VHPCTIAQVKQKLAALPAEDLLGIRRIRLSAAKMEMVDAMYHEGTITIYAVPESFKFSYPCHPGDSFISESTRWGARWQRLGGEWYCYWDKERYGRYILDHVLLHEIGHHQDDFHRRRTGEGIEKFAERYALQAEAGRGTPGRQGSPRRGRESEQADKAERTSR